MTKFKVGDKVTVKFKGVITEKDKDNIYTVEIKDSVYEETEVFAYDDEMELLEPGE